jgi:hypothetical protein
MSPPARGRLRAALSEHRAALGNYVRRAGRVAPEEWHRPASPGKWSPAEITEHLTLAVEKLHLELRGEASMKVILTSWKRFTLRCVILPSILRTGRFPRRVRAPREIRPTAPSGGRDEALRRLEDSYARFESASGEPSASGRKLTHPYFGPISLPRFHRLLARHADHHARQLPPEPAP